VSTGITATLRQLHAGEKDLEQHLLVVGERHSSEHEVRHVTVQLARWSLRNRQEMSVLADAHGSFLADDLEEQAPSGVAEAMREKTAALLGTRPEPGLLLLRDLRELYLMASGNAVLWTMLGQAAQAAKDSQLLDVVNDCHPRTLRQVRWCNGTIKAIAPQVLTSV
jgi:hypothetical protein